MKYQIGKYKKLEGRIKRGDLDALLARWLVGKRLLGERGDAGRLPNGRLEELSNALGSSRAELNNRMRFAAKYRTKDKVAMAFEFYEYWHRICAEGLDDKGAALSDAALEFAKVQRELENWELLDPGDLDGLSDLQQRTLVTALRRAYELYCDDPARGKIDSWTESPAPSELRHPPENWHRNGGWYPVYMVSKSMLRKLAQQIIADRLPPAEIERQLDLWARLHARRTAQASQPAQRSTVRPDPTLACSVAHMHKAALEFATVAADVWEYWGPQYVTIAERSSGFTVRFEGARVVIERGEVDWDAIRAVPLTNRSVLDDLIEQPSSRS